MIYFFDGVDRKRVWDGLEAARRAGVRYADLLNGSDGLLWMASAIQGFRIRWPIGRADSEVRCAVDLEVLEPAIEAVSVLIGDVDSIPAHLEQEFLRIGEERPERPWIASTINLIPEMFLFDDVDNWIPTDSLIPDGKELLRVLARFSPMRFEETHRFSGPWIVDTPYGRYAAAATPYSAVFRRLGDPSGPTLQAILPESSLSTIEPVIDYAESVHFNDREGWLILHCPPGIISVQVYLDNLAAHMSKLLEIASKPMPNRVGPVPASVLRDLLEAARSHRHSAPPALPMWFQHREGHLIVSVAHVDKGWRFEAKLATEGSAPDKMMVSLEQILPVLKSMPEREVRLEWDGEIMRVSGESFVGLVAGMRQ